MLFQLLEDAWSPPLIMVAGRPERVRRDGAEVSQRNSARARQASCWHCQHRDIGREEGGRGRRLISVMGDDESPDSGWPIGPNSPLSIVDSNQRREPPDMMSA